MKTNVINSKETTRVYAAERMGVHIRLDRHHRRDESPWYSASAILPERGLYLMTAGSTRLKAADQLDRELRRRVELGPSAGAVEALLTALSEEAQREAERRKQMETEEFRDTVRRGFCPYCGS